MTIKEFIDQYFTHANKTADKSGVPALVILTQAALESGWGKTAPGYNFFGITADANYTGKRQLVKTTEYHKTNDVKYPVIHSVVYQSTGSKAGYYKYTVSRYFRAYDNAEQAFDDYARLLQNDRYSKAFNHTNNPEKFLYEIAKAGYATNPGYTTLAIQVMNSIKRRVS